MQLVLGVDVDIVHWNNGLWDVLHLFGDDAFTPIEQYNELLVRVFNRIKYLFPKAKNYFSLSTPAIEQMANKDFCRKNNEIEQYNQEAINGLSPLGVKIINFFSKAKSSQPQYNYDWVHYNEKVASILADYIIQKMDI